jgi:hypothetical protein
MVHELSAAIDASVLATEKLASAKMAGVVRRKEMAGSSCPPCAHALQTRPERQLPQQSARKKTVPDDGTRLFAVAQATALNDCNTTTS